MKKVLWFVALLALVGTVAWFGHERSLAAQSEEESGELRLFGKVDIRDAQLAFFGQERIAEVLVEEGQAVEAGQPLARLRTQRLLAERAGLAARIAAQQARLASLVSGTRPQELERARASVAAAEVRAANAARVLERLQGTTESGASSAQEADEAQAALSIARAGLAVEQATLALAVEGPREEQLAEARAVLDALRAEDALLQVRLDDSELRAPSKGVIQSRILEPGEMASPERPVLTLALTDPKWVRAFVPEPELGRLALGMRASIFSDSFGGRSYAGWVGFVSPVSEFTPKSVETEELRTRLVYEVRLFVEDPEGELRLGMPVSARIDTLGGGGHAPAGTPGSTGALESESAPGASGEPR